LIDLHLERQAGHNEVDVPFRQSEGRAKRDLLAAGRHVEGQPQRRSRHRQ
jgi:hypothetical protein